MCKALPSTAVQYCSRARVKVATSERGDDGGGKGLVPLLLGTLTAWTEIRGEFPASACGATSTVEDRLWRLVEGVSRSKSLDQSGLLSDLDVMVVVVIVAKAQLFPSQSASRMLKESVVG